MTDVNECAKFLGTDLGCQNGATCRNLPGSYRYSILTIINHFLLQQVAKTTHYLILNILTNLQLTQEL